MIDIKTLIMRSADRQIDSETDSDKERQTARQTSKSRITRGNFSGASSARAECIRMSVCLPVGCETKTCNFSTPQQGQTFVVPRIRNVRPSQVLIVSRIDLKCRRQTTSLICQSSRGWLR